MSGDALHVDTHTTMAVCMYNTLRVCPLLNEIQFLVAQLWYFYCGVWWWSRMLKINGITGFQKLGEIDMGWCRSSACE